MYGRSQFHWHLENDKTRAAVIHLSSLTYRADNPLGLLSSKHSLFRQGRTFADLLVLPTRGVLRPPVTATYDCSNNILDS